MANKVNTIAAELVANPRPDAGDGDPIVRLMDIENAVIEAFDLDLDEDAARIERLSGLVDAHVARLLASPTPVLSALVEDFFG